MSRRSLYSLPYRHMSSVSLDVQILNLDILGDRTSPDLSIRGPVSPPPPHSYPISHPRPVVYSVFPFRPVSHIFNANVPPFLRPRPTYFCPQRFRVPFCTHVPFNPCPVVRPCPIFSTLLSRLFTRVLYILPPEIPCPVLLLVSRLALAP